MKSIKLLVLALVLGICALTSTHAAVVYSDGGSGGSGSTVINDVSGPLLVSYDSYEWSAFYDDDGLAYFSYTLYSGVDRYDVLAVFGGPPPSTGWNFWGVNSDGLASSHPDFLDPFWSVAP